MKKQLSVAITILCAITLLFWSGCQKDPADEQVPDNPQDHTITHDTNANSNSPDASRYIVHLGNGIGPVRFGMSHADVIECLGAPEKVMHEGRSLLYPSKGFSLLVSPNRGVAFINCYTKLAAPPNLSAGDFQGMTTESIAMGATVRQIKTAYGEPDSEVHTGAQTDLQYNALGIRFILLDDALAQFFVNPP